MPVGSACGLWTAAREQEVQDWGSIKNAIKDQLGQFVWGRTKRQSDDSAHYPGSLMRFHAA